MTTTKRCPINYTPISADQKYSVSGLKKLSPTLTELHDLPFTAAMQRLEAVERASKLSIQGVQSKLSAILNTAEAEFQLADNNGRYILKPQNELYEQLPENEDLTMRLADSIGIEIPLHGLVYSIDNSFTYFIKRFDRSGHQKKIAVEDFAQLTRDTRDTKYQSSMEKVASVVERYCTFPVLEKKKLFQRTLFNFLIGNEDMHLKNFSLIYENNKVQLSPAYDLLNSTIALKAAREELALPLNGKKRNLTRRDFINYYAYERLQLNENVVNGVLNAISEKIPTWIELINMSFLSEELKEKYLILLRERVDRLY